MTVARYNMLVLGLILLAGCSGGKVSQGVYQGLYDGCRLEEDLMRMPYERLGQPDMDFRQYSNALKVRNEERQK